MTFLPQEIIRTKRDGRRLDRDDIARFIAGLADGSVSPAQAGAFLMAVYLNDMDRDERVALTLAMRDSGVVMDWSDLPGPTVDKHSTGGVGDNVSLMLAPILAACGAYVPMISGRGLGHSGGTLDKLDAIPGYRTNPDRLLFRRVVEEAGCAIIGQTDDLAPADRVLYAIRDVTATVENISLITASILSKKLAAGLGALVLDVKTGSGAFMTTLEAAQALADSLVSVSNGAGLPTSALITDMNEPLASAAGNALEVRNAVEFLTGRHQDPRLREVTVELSTAALAMSRLAPDAVAAGEKVEAALTSGRAVEQFGKMVRGLGGPADFIERAETYLPAAPVIADVFTRAEGVISAIDTRALGMAVVALGGGRRTPDDRIDHAVGLDRLAGLGQKADGQTPIARVHARTQDEAEEAAARVRAAYRIGETAPHNPLIADRIGLPGGR